MTLASLLGIVVFLVGVPAVVAFLLAFPQYRRIALGVMVFTTCYVKKPLYQEVFFVDYRGVDRGFMVAMPDILFFGFAIVLLIECARKRLIWKPYNTLPWIALILVATISTALSDRPLLGAFTLHKMVRCLILYWVIVNTVKDRRDTWAVIHGLAAALLFEGWITFWDKYVTHAVVNRSMGTFRHPNTLAMYSNLIGPVLLAVALTSQAKGYRLVLLISAVVSGLLCVVFTKSRAAIILHPAALGGAAVLSFLFKPALRKASLLSMGVFAGLIIGLLALPKIIARFEKAPEESAETRVYFNHAAVAMAHDRFFGIGLNQYSEALANGTYYWYVYPDKVDVADPEAFRASVRGQSRLGTVHNIYLLYASELGWVGMGLFLVHIGRFALLNVWLMFRDKDEIRRAILFGLLAGTAVHHVQGMLEWIFRQTEVMYIYFVLMGLMVAGRAEWRRERLAGRPGALPA